MESTIEKTFTKMTSQLMPHLWYGVAVPWTEVVHTDRESGEHVDALQQIYYSIQQDAESVAFTIHKMTVAAGTDVSVVSGMRWFEGGEEIAAVLGKSILHRSRKRMSVSKFVGLVLGDEATFQEKFPALNRGTLIESIQRKLDVLLSPGKPNLTMEVYEGPAVVSAYKDMEEWCHSCMTGKKSHWTEIWGTNPKQVKLLVFKVNDTPYSRCLIYRPVDDKNMVNDDLPLGQGWYYSRIYANQALASQTKCFDYTKKHLEDMGMSCLYALEESSDPKRGWVVRLRKTEFCPWVDRGYLTWDRDTDKIWWSPSGSVTVAGVRGDIVDNTVDRNAFEEYDECYCSRCECSMCEDDSITSESGEYYCRSCYDEVYTQDYVGEEILVDDAIPMVSTLYSPSFSRRPFGVDGTFVLDGTCEEKYVAVFNTRDDRAPHQTIKFVLCSTPHPDETPERWAKVFAPEEETFEDESGTIWWRGFGEHVIEVKKVINLEYDGNDVKVVLTDTDSLAPVTNAHCLVLDGVETWCTLHHKLPHTTPVVDENGKLSLVVTSWSLSCDKTIASSRLLNGIRYLLNKDGIILRKLPVSVYSGFTNCYGPAIWYEGDKFDDTVWTDLSVMVAPCPVVSVSVSDDSVLSVYEGYVVTRCSYVHAVDMRSANLTMDENTHHRTVLLSGMNSTAMSDFSDFLDHQSRKHGTELALLRPGYHRYSQHSALFVDAATFMYGQPELTRRSIHRIVVLKKQYGRMLTLVYEEDRLTPTGVLAGTCVLDHSFIRPELSCLLHDLDVSNPATRDAVLKDIVKLMDEAPIGRRITYYDWMLTEQQSIALEALQNNSNAAKTAVTI